MLKLRQRLLHRIARRYQVVTEPVAFGPLRFPFTRIVDPDRVLDEVAAEADLRDRLAGKHAQGDQLHLPYWAELWDSARGIGEHLVGSAKCGGGSAECKVQSAEWGREGSAKCRVQSAKCGSGIRQDEIPSPLCTLHSALCTSSALDLGCGMGMSGVVAAALGARVVFADLEAPALLFAQLNSLPWRQRVQTRRLDWQSDRLSQKFDRILGADILYERAQWPWLNTFWRAHLAAGGQVILGEPGRQTGEMFVEWITSQGWRLIVSDVPVSSRPKPIRIFIIS